MSSTNWSSLFTDKSPDEMVDLFQDKLKAIMASHIPNKIKTFNERDAPWITPEVKTAIRKNKRVFKKWSANGRQSGDRSIVTNTQRETNKKI